MGLTARTRKPLWIFGSLLFVASLVLVQCKLAEQRFYFRAVPHGMPVGDLAYQSEESWGLPFMAMPGDNETGIRLFKLAPEVVEDFRRHGVAAGAHYGHQFGEAWKVNDPRRRGLYSE